MRSRNRAKSPKSDRTPPKAIPLNLRRKHDCVLVEPLKSDTVILSDAKTPKSDRTPPSRLWHRIIQGVSANAHVCRVLAHVKTVGLERVHQFRSGMEGGMLDFKTSAAYLDLSCISQQTVGWLVRERWSGLGPKVCGLLIGPSQSTGFQFSGPYNKDYDALGRWGPPS